MDSFRRLLEINREVILFVYGLVFFVMGLAIALQSRHYSRLDLARSLSWLAAFGITHGLHEWGDFFIPIQSAYLAAPAVALMTAIHLLLLGASFACLFEFGVALLRPFGRMRWLHGVSIALLLVWALATFMVVLPLSSDFNTWRNATNALARYCIGFPGALLAAYGLRQQTQQRIAPLGVPHINRSLSVAVVALALYAFFGGLIPPVVPFTPGNWLNASTFEQVIGVPPMVFRAVLGFILALAMIRALEVFELETDRMIEAMEQQQILAAERDRIGRELHDGAIQTVYTAGLLVQSAHQHAEPGSPLAERLERAMAVLNSAIGDLRRNMGELRGGALGDTLPEGLRRLATDPRFNSFVDVQVDIDLHGCEQLSPFHVDHILAITGEALSNVVRHAHARRVTIVGRCTADRFHLVIRDDGTGASRDTGSGYGTRNMRDRARLLGGRLTVDGVSGKGTTLTLDVPMKDER